MCIIPFNNTTIIYIVFSNHYGKISEFIDLSDVEV